MSGEARCSTLPSSSEEIKYLDRQKNHGQTVAYPYSKNVQTILAREPAEGPRTIPLAKTKINEEAQSQLSCNSAPSLSSAKYLNELRSAPKSPAMFSTTKVR